MRGWRTCASVACLSLTLASSTDVYARPPTAGDFHVSGGASFGETFASDLNPYRYGVHVRAGYTLLNGLYVGGLVEMYGGDEGTDTEAMTFSAKAAVYGGVLGVDLKLANTASLRLTAMGGIRRLEREPTARERDALQASVGSAFERQTNEAFIGPSLEVVLIAWDSFCLIPSARLMLLVEDELQTVAVFGMSLGLTL